MTRNEGLLRLKAIGSAALHIVQLIETGSSQFSQESEIRKLATNLKDQLQKEYERILPERAQRSMPLFELTVYSPTLEEIWKETGMSKLKFGGSINSKWNETFEAIAYKAAKYVLIVLKRRKSH